jgi:hypothetical protein
VHESFRTWDPRGRALVGGTIGIGGASGQTGKQGPFILFSTVSLTRSSKKTENIDFVAARRMPPAKPKTLDSSGDFWPTKL